jgi:Ca2+:H+ antiporter
VKEDDEGNNHTHKHMHLSLLSFWPFSSFVFCDSMILMNLKEHGPVWSKFRCIVILLVGTVMFAMVSDQLTTALESTIKSVGLTQTFVGVFFIGVFTNAAELINAVSFALRNNIALAIEIGAAGTVQVQLFFEHFSTG